MTRDHPSHEFSRIVAAKPAAYATSMKSGSQDVQTARRNALLRELRYAQR
jgi:hypothetical protein